jgi:hypothetical protein
VKLHAKTFHALILGLQVVYLETQVSDAEIDRAAIGLDGSRRLELKDLDESLADLDVSKASRRVANLEALVAVIAANVPVQFVTCSLGANDRAVKFKASVKVWRRESDMVQAEIQDVLLVDRV